MKNIVKTGLCIALMSTVLVASAADLYVNSESGDSVSIVVGGTTHVVPNPPSARSNPKFVATLPSGISKITINGNMQFDLSAIRPADGAKNYYIYLGTIKGCRGILAGWLWSSKWMTETDSTQYSCDNLTTNHAAIYMGEAS